MIAMDAEQDLYGRFSEPGKLFFKILNFLGVKVWIAKDLRVSSPEGLSLLSSCNSCPIPYFLIPSIQ